MNRRTRMRKRIWIANGRKFRISFIKSSERRINLKIEKLKIILPDKTAKLLENLIKSWKKLGKSFKEHLRIKYVLFL